MIRKWLFIIGLLTELQPGFAQSGDYNYCIDNFPDHLVKENSFLGAVELKKCDDIIYSFKSNPLEPENCQYRIGSVTEIFTAIIIFQLIEEQKLILQIPLSNYYLKIKALT